MAAESSTPTMTTTTSTRSAPAPTTAAAARPCCTVLLQGQIELKVPLIFGTLQWGTTWFDHCFINGRHSVTDTTCRGILSVLATGGVTLLDTAEGYGGGTSEKRLGRLLSLQKQQQKTHPKDEQQQQENNSGSSFFIMTKFLPTPWRGLYQGQVERAVRASCERLQVACIDIYLLHSPVHWRGMEYWVQAFARVRDQGLIRCMGLSNCNAEQVRRAVVEAKKYNLPVVCNQVHYSLLDYNSKELQEMEATCRELNVTIIAYSPLGQGLLTDSLTATSFQSNKPAKMLRLQSMQQLDPLRTALRTMANKYQKSMAQIALQWCIQHNVIPLVGCRRVEQAIDSVGAVENNGNVLLLSEAEVQTLDTLALDRSTLQSPPWRRALFVTLFGIVNIVCSALDYFGFGNYGVEEEDDEKKTLTTAPGKAQPTPNAPKQEKGL